MDKAPAVELTGDDSYPREIKSEHRVVVKQEEELGDKASENSNEDKDYSDNDRDGEDSYQNRASELVQDDFLTIGPGNREKEPKPPQCYIPQLNAGGSNCIRIGHST